MGGNGQEQECGKDHGWKRRKVVAELGEMEGRGSFSHRYWLDPLPHVKVCKVFEGKELSPDLGSVIKCGSPATGGRASTSFPDSRITGPSRVRLWKGSTADDPEAALIISKTALSLLIRVARLCRGQ